MHGQFVELVINYRAIDEVSSEFDEIGRQKGEKNDRKCQTGER